MKRFLQRLFVFSIVVFLILRVLDIALPYYWGNPGIATKIEFLEEKQDAYNLFFMGSSRVYRQIDPEIFDAHTDSIHSFNLAYRATFNPETYYLLEHFIKRKATQPTYIMIELQNFIPIADKNLGTIEASYYLNYPQLKLAIQDSIQGKSVREIWQNDFTKNYLKAYWNNIWNVGQLKEITAAHPGKGERTKKALGAAKNGFRPLDADIKTSKGLCKRLERLHANSDNYQGKSTYLAALNEYKKYQNRACSKTHLEYIQQIIKKAEGQNYHLIFLLPPKKPELLPLFTQIDENHKINMCDPVDFPHLYETKYWFDEKHLNEYGAALFSRYLVDKFEHTRYPF